MPEYACTHVTKEAARWHPKDGVGITRRLTIDEEANLVAPTMAGLLLLLAQRYTYQPIDDLFIPPDENEDGVTHVSHRQTETVDCDKPTARDEELWRAGGKTLYLCDYEFAVEAREARPLTPADLEGVKTH